MPSSVTLLKKSLSVFLVNPKRYLSITAVPVFLSLVLFFLLPNITSETASPFQLVIYLVLTLVSMIASIEMTIALVYAVADTSITSKEAYAKATHTFFKYIVLSIVMSAIIVAAFLLLIVPGVWLSVSFAFATFFLLLKGTGIKESIKKSMALVKGRWWEVATKLSVLFLASIVFYLTLNFVANIVGSQTSEFIGKALSTAVGYLAAPFSIIFTYELFLALESNSVVEVLKVETAPQQESTPAV